MSAHREGGAEAWAGGGVENMARDPEGGDIDQLAAVAAGECDIAVANTYYLGRLLASDDPDDRAVGEKIGVIFPRSEEHTSELQSLMRISYAVFCLKKKNSTTQPQRR